MHNIYVGFDRDGTLEMQNVFMPDGLKKKIIALEKSGVFIFLASGKNMDLLINLSKDIGMNPAIICAENGGHIYDFKNKHEFIFGQTQDLKSFKELIQKEKLPPNKYEHKVSIWSRKFDQHVIEAGQIIENFIKKKRLKLSVFTYPNGDGGLDVIPSEVDKINLLKLIPKNSIIHYFGDSDNDLGLMKDSRVTPHTVSNANSFVKEQVINKGGYVAKNPAGIGVLDILFKIL